MTSLTVAKHRYVLAIDQGTTGSTAMILKLVEDQKRGLILPRVLASANVEFPQLFPQAGWVEHRLEDIWVSVMKAIRCALNKSRIAPKKISAIGITNQRETICFWNKKNLKPLCNAIVWQDRRTTNHCQELKDKNLGPTITAKTGLLLDPYFSATKMAAVLPSLLKKNSLASIATGTVDSFLVARLTGGAHLSEPSNASRTLLFNIKTLAWDDDLLDIFKIPKQILPQVQDSSGAENFGVTKGLGLLPDGIPITGILGDQQAALFGQGCFEIGEAKCTYGTGSFILVNTGNKPVVSHHQQLTTIAWKLGEDTCYALEGSAFAAGACVQWLRDGLGFFKTSQEVESLAKKVSSSQGVYFVPALAGLGSPYWSAHARGSFLGLTRGSTQAHLCRAVLEGIAFINADILRAMEKDMKKSLALLRADGGASRNDLLMQLQANALNCVISRSTNVESTALGAALVASWGIGAFKSYAELKTGITQMDLGKKTKREFHPKMKTQDRSHWLNSWKSAVGATISFNS